MIAKRCLLRFAAPLALLLTTFVFAGDSASSAGPPLLPDLQTLAPTALRFDVVQMTDGAHNVLRFDNTVHNVGPGRLELEGRKRSKIYQRVYDAPQGGSLVETLFLGNDGVFHKGHNHYHLENFASYTLQQQVGGAYVDTTQVGTKTSFCVIDVTRVSGSYSPQYWQCGRAVQGLTVGWGDTYNAALADQWIDLGKVVFGQPALADGQYAVKSKANPAVGGSPHIAEANGGNNVGIRFFNVAGGVITEAAELTAQP
jgi:hypothetical protein